MKIPRFAIALMAAVCLSGCETTAPASGMSRAASAPVPSQLSFVDINKFDNDLHASLLAHPDMVSVVFYEKVSPNSTPERLQRWLNVVEKTGGKVDVEPPPGELVPRNPFALISLLGGLWNAIKMTTEVKQDSMLLAARGRDAVISLERNREGQVVISKVSFKANKP
ncbi:hypothetical protein [Limnohabitans sp.]|uniref:hypothetical protein n=1 Tax=Limnohabitans sp. TaxID=1907725 RepID=UPI0038BBE403